jgi:anti-anti-sigma factor
MFMCEPVVTMEEGLLTLEFQHQPHATVLRCSGRILHGDGAETLRRAVMSQETRNLELDLSNVDAIDANGLGTLVALEKWARERGQTIQLTNVSRRVLDAIEITRLTPILLANDCVHDRDDAA